jgi:hypothetical protein
LEPNLNRIDLDKIPGSIQAVSWRLTDGVAGLPAAFTSGPGQANIERFNQHAPVLESVHDPANTGRRDPNPFSSQKNDEFVFSPARVLLTEG